MALANAIEVGLWHHSILTEITTGEFIDLRPNNEDTFPLCTPFRAHRALDLPTSERCDSAEAGATTLMCSVECQFEPRVVLFAEQGKAELHCIEHSCSIDGGPIYAASERSGLILITQNDARKENVRVLPELVHPNLAEREAMTLLKVVALSDCANIFSAVSNWQPRSVDKLTNLSLCFIRDLSQQINFSFLDAEYNLADTSTKYSGNRHLYYLLCDTRRFVLSFVGRKKLKMEKALDQGDKEKLSESSARQGKSDRVGGIPAEPTS